MGCGTVMPQRDYGSDYGDHGDTMGRLWEGTMGDRQRQLS